MEAMGSKPESKATCLPSKPIFKESVEYLKIHFPCLFSCNWQKITLGMDGRFKHGHCEDASYYKGRSRFVGTTLVSLNARKTR